MRASAGSSPRTTTASPVSGRQRFNTGSRARAAAGKRSESITGGAHPGLLEGRMMRTVKVIVTDEQGVLLDSETIEIEDNETKIALVSLHRDRVEPNSSASTLHLGEKET